MNIPIHKEDAKLILDALLCYEDANQPNSREGSIEILNRIDILRAVFRAIVDA